MKFMKSLFQNAFFIHIALSFTKAINADTTDYDLRWSSSGGGWLAMMANIGYTKLFQKLDIWNETSCSLSAITAFSGGTWFFTQFMFSKQFFTILHDSDENEINQFIINWMNSYAKFQEDSPVLTAPTICNAISPFGLHDNLESISDLCRTIFETDGDYSSIIEGMFKQVSTDLYNDPNFVNRPMNSENRLSVFDNTELHTITGFSTTSTVFKDHWYRLFHSDTITYVSPKNDISSRTIPNIFSVPIPILHVVKAGVDKNSSFFVMGTEASSLPLHATVVTKANSVSRRFKFQDWEHLPLYPGTNGLVYTNLKKPNWYSRIEKYILREPFGGQIPTVSQINGITSSASSILSSAVPSLFAQYYSTANFDTVGTSSKRQLLLLINLIYKAKVFRDFSICSQWPKPCTKYDGRFIDGGFVDGIGLDWNIGQYQTGNNGNLSKTLKILATSNNGINDEGVKISAYFNTSYNQNVEPGEFTWAPGFGGESFKHHYNPWRSIQVFNTYLDYEEMMNNTNITTKIIGTNITTSFVETITLDNPIFGVKAGQKVQLLFFQTNSNIPTAIVTKDSIEANKVPLAELATTIMSNTQLYDVVADFLNNK